MLSQSLAILKIEQVQWNQNYVSSVWGVVMDENCWTCEGRGMIQLCDLETFN